MTKFTNSWAVMTTTQKTVIINQILRFISMLKCVKIYIWELLRYKAIQQISRIQDEYKRRLHSFTINRWNTQLVVLEILSFFALLRATKGGGKCTTGNLPPHFPDPLPSRCFPTPFPPQHIHQEPARFSPTRDFSCCICNALAP